MPGSDFSAPEVYRPALFGALAGAGVVTTLVAAVVWIALAGPSPLLALLVVPLAFFVYALAWGEQYAGE